MTQKKVKHIQYLEQFKDCPSSDFKEIDRYAYRWTQNPITSTDFILVNIIGEPPARILDDTNKMCMAYGLSMFDSLKNSIDKYQKEYINRRQHQREQFIQQIGEQKSNKKHCIKKTTVNTHVLSITSHHAGRALFTVASFIGFKIAYPSTDHAVI